MKRVLPFLLVWLALCYRIPAADPPTVEGCEIFPSDNIWNTRVDTLPVHPMSEHYINTIGSNAPLHPDFGSGAWPPGSDGLLGIPYVVVPGTQAMVDVTFTISGESDPGPYPIPPDALIEGGTNSGGDRHILVIDRDNSMLYELFAAYPQTNGTWLAGSGAIFNLASNDLRPETWTSADAAGLPIFPGLVRFEEVASGRIEHALRFTVPSTQRSYIWPARHFASVSTDPLRPPMGLRLRLKKSYDISPHDPTNRVILRALQEYGLILADNGSAMFVQGAPSESWDNDALHYLEYVHAGSFEAVDVTSLVINSNSAAVAYPDSRLSSVTTGATSIEVDTEELYPGVTYAVEKSTNLMGNDWTNITAFEAGGQATNWSSSLPSDSSAYFRLRVEN